MLSAFPKAKELLADRGYDAGWFRNALLERGITPCIPSRKTRKVAVAYDKDLYKHLAFIGAFHSRTHKHCDDLSFIWSEGKDNILVDSGMQYSYTGLLDSGNLWEKGFSFSGANIVYSESVHAHNCVEINTECYSRKVKPYGALPLSGHRISEHIWTLAGSWKRLENFLQKRTIVLSPNLWLLVFDDLSPSKKSEKVVTMFSQWFHFDRKLSLISNSDNAVILSLSSQRQLHCQNLCAGKISIHRGEFTPRLQGWQATESHQWLEPALALGIHKHANTAHFATLFSLCGPCISFERHNHMFHLQFEDGIYDNFTI